MANMYPSKQDAFKICLNGAYALASSSTKEREITNYTIPASGTYLITIDATCNVSNADGKINIYKNSSSSSFSSTNWIPTWGTGASVYLCNYAKTFSFNANDTLSFKTDWVNSHSNCIWKANIKIIRIK